MRVVYVVPENKKYNGLRKAGGELDHIFSEDEKSYADVPEVGRVGMPITRLLYLDDAHPYWVRVKVAQRRRTRKFTYSTLQGLLPDVPAWRPLPTRV